MATPATKAMNTTCTAFPSVNGVKKLVGIICKTISMRVLISNTSSPLGLAPLKKIKHKGSVIA